MIDRNDEGQILCPGDVVSVWVGLYRHKGIYVGRGEVIAASLDRGRVVRQSLDEFAEGRPLRNEGFPGRRPRQAVVDAAAACLGRPYSVLTDNCEHFVNEVHGLPRRSPQLQAAAIAGLALVAVLALARKRPAA